MGKISILACWQQAWLAGVLYSQAEAHGEQIVATAAHCLHALSNLSEVMPQRDFPHKTLLHYSAEAESIAPSLSRELPASYQNLHYTHLLMDTASSEMHSKLPVS